MMTADHAAEIALIEVSRMQRAFFETPAATDPISGFHPDDIAHTMRFWACDRDEAIHILHSEWDAILADDGEIA